MNINRIKTFLKSLWFHIGAGLPKATQKQINERYQICRACVSFDSKKNQCFVCGCNVNTKRVFLNKLAWADQSCPLGRWEKINVNETQK